MKNRQLCGRVAILALALLPALALAHGVSSRDALFVAGAIFLLYRLRDVAVYASLFALGHSVTLLGAVLLGLRVNPQLGNSGTISGLGVGGDIGFSAPVM